MAILDMQGFTTGASAGALGFLGSGNVTSPTGGRFSGGYVTLIGNNQTFVRFCPARSSIGLHFSINPSGFNANFMALAESSTGFSHAVIYGDQGRLFASYGGGTIVDSGVAISPSTWIGIEVWLVVSNTVGVLKVWLNGSSEPVIDVSGADTRNGGTGVVDTFAASLGGSSAPTFLYSDWVVYDDQSPATSAPIGDVRVQSLFPSGNGNSSQFVGSDSNSTDNYLLVDETPYNSDTDYVESSTVGDKDTYAFGDLTPTTGSILAVQARLVAKKTDAGTRELKPVYRSGSTEVDGTIMTLGSAYAINTADIQETKPGGGAWSIANVNAAEFGVKVSA